MLSGHKHLRGLIGGLAIATAVAAGAAAHASATPALQGAAAANPAATTVKKVLFDDTKAETAGNADWIISTSMPDPTQQNASPTKETDWTGALSAWGVALQKTGGYQLDTLPAGNTITYGTGGALDLKNFDTFVLDEPNTQLTAAEKTAVMQFVQNGGGLFLISDHKGSDRDNDGWDSPKVINDLFTNNGVDNSDPFGISDDNVNITSGTPTAINDSTDPVLNGSFGKVTSSEIDSGTTWTLHPSDNANAKGLLYTSGSSGSTGVFFATSTYGSGRVAVWGDSSPVDDGTGQSGNTLYNGWNTDSNAALALNATAWLAGTGSAGGGTGGTTTGGTTGGGTGGCTAGQLLANPGFESGTSGWTASSGIINTSSKEPARTGSYKAWLDGYGTSTTDTVAQSVTIPAGCTSASLSFWMHVDTAETTTSKQYDTLKVQVLNSSGTVLGTLGTFSNLNHNTGYAQHTYSLAAYAGQTVTLKFTGVEDYQDQTSFVVDDTSLTVG